jgi:signal transduction histidine kinase/AmiR/NasT family two-component response regulator
MKNRRTLIVEYKTGSTGNLEGALKALRYSVKRISFRIDEMDEVIREFAPQVMIVDMSVHADKNIIAKATHAQSEFSVPVIYFTEAINSRTLYQTMKTNHYGYIYTPYDESTLQTTIELAMHKHKTDMSVRESELKYKELFSNMTSGVVVYELRDLGSRYVLVDINRAGERLLKKEREDMIDKPVTSIFTNATQYGLLDTLKRVQADDKPETVKAHYYEDETVSMWLNSYIYKLPSGEFVHIFHDITEQINAETELKNKQKELEKLNVELAKTVVEETDKRIKNEQVLFEQSRFLAMGQMISAIEHQWRQPLSALGINIEDLEDAYATGDLDSDYINDLTKDSMTLIKTISKTMEDLNSFFKTSQLEETLSIPMALSQVHGLLLARLSNSDISFQILYTKDDSTKEAYDNDVTRFIADLANFTVNGVPAEFKQVIINILNNSIDAILERKSKSTDYFQGIISLELDHRPESVNLYIRDNGVGISHEAISKIFEPYYSTKESGSGIGLYMSKIIVEQHMQGRISASPLPNGAIFSITLPLSK